MKHLTNSIVISLVALLLLVSCAPVVTLLSPKGGENYSTEENLEVKWVSRNVSSVDFILINGSTALCEVNNQPSAGYYYLDISGLPTSSDYYIKITGTGNIGFDDDISDKFIINDIKQYLAITNPVNDSEWEVGKTYNIDWTSNSIGPTVSIQLYKNDKYQSTIESSTANDGTYSWTVPSVALGSEYSICIISTSFPAISGKSDEFNIIAKEPLRTIAITNPVNDSEWEVGKTYNIDWTSNSIGPTVSIQLYKNDKYQSTIESSTANDGTYSWTVPSVALGSEYSICIASVLFPNIYNESNKLSIIQSNSPQIDKIIDTVIHDGNGGGKGNKDRKVQIGEEIDLEVEVKNNGTGNARNILGKLSIASNDANYCKITDSKEAIKIVASGQSAKFDDFDFEVLGMPLDETFDFILTITYEDDYGNSYSNSITFSESVYQISRNLTIAYPTDTSRWIIGKTYNIRWTSENAGDNVDIAVVDSKGKIHALANSTPNDGTFDWTVSGIEAGPSSYITITSNDFPNVCTNSLFFSIIIPTLIYKPPFSKATTWKAAYDVSALMGKGYFYSSENSSSGYLTHYGLGKSLIIGGGGVLISNYIKSKFSFPCPGEYYLEFEGDITYILHTASFTKLAGANKSLFDIKLEGGLSGYTSKTIHYINENDQLTPKNFLNEIFQQSLNNIIANAPLVAGTSSVFALTLAKVSEITGLINNVLPANIDVCEPFKIKIPISMQGTSGTWYLQLTSETVAMVTGLTGMMSQLGIRVNLTSVTVRPR